MKKTLLLASILLHNCLLMGATDQFVSFTEPAAQSVRPTATSSSCCSA